MKTNYITQKIASAILLLSPPINAQFNPIPTATLHHIAPKQETSWGTKINQYLVGDLIATYSPDSKLLATTLPLHNAIKVHDPITGKLMWELQLPRLLEQLDIDMSPTFRKYLDLSEAPLQVLLGNYRTRITAVEFSPDSSKIFVASFRVIDKVTEALILDALTGAINTRLANAGHIDRVSFSPDGKLLITATSKRDDDSPAKLWDVATGNLVATLDILNGQGNAPSHVKNVSSVAFNASGTLLYTSSDNGHIKVWNAPDGTLLKSLPQTTSAPFSVSPDKSYLLANSWSNQVLLFEGFSGTLKKSFSHTHSLWNLLLPPSFSPNDPRIMTASTDGVVKIWHPDGNLLFTITAQSGLRSARFSPDGLRIITQDKNYAQIWDAVTGELIIDFGNLPTALFDKTHQSSSALLSNDGKQVLLISGAKAQIWALPPAVFTNEKSLTTTKNSLVLRSLKTMLQSYLPYVHIDQKPSLEKFIEKYPEKKRIGLMNLLKDICFLHQDVCFYLQALFPELKQ